MFFSFLDINNRLNVVCCVGCVVHRELRDRSQIPRLFANLANKAESESESECDIDAGCHVHKEASAVQSSD